VKLSSGSILPEKMSSAFFVGCDMAAEVHKKYPYSFFYASRHQNDVSL